jgi:uncharacterized protein
LKFRKEKNHYYISLEPGEKINSSFEKIAKIEEINSAWIHGIGAVTNLEMGYYELATKSYIRKFFNYDYELTSLSGNITFKDETVFSHTHINFSDNNFNVYGGHLFEGEISAAGEFIMTVGENFIHRKFDDFTGLALWCLEK